MIFEAHFDPYVEDYDKNGKLTLPALLKLLENAGNRHSDKAGNAVIAGSASGFAWILTDWKVRIDEYPAYGQKLAVQTWIEPPAIPFGIARDLLLLADGKPCAEAQSKWVLFDMAKKRPCKVDESLLSAYGTEDKTVFGGDKMEKITVPESFSAEKTIPLRRSDIDFNNHVHNLCYLDFALETLPQSQYANAAFKHVRITYKTALTENDTALCKQTVVDDRTVTAIFTDDGTLCCVVELR